MKSIVLITGSAGFIGFHLAEKLAADGIEVIGLDNLNNYYDVKLKLDRLEHSGIDSRKIAYNEPVKSKKYSNYTFIQLGIEDAANLERLFGKNNIQVVIHLAAQAGVRYSIKHPEAYIQSNIVGFFNVLESCRHNKVNQLVFASSSSVYGNKSEVPFKVSSPTDNPISFYAATKKSNELMAHTYSHLFNINITGLRFFTVYGPWGRPDMAYSLFTKAILEEEPIKVFNNGNLSRDFTYVDDIVDGVISVLYSYTNKKESGKDSTNNFKLYNIGSSEPVSLLEFIQAIEEELGLEARKKMLPMQLGDVETTYADISLLKKDTGYSPKTTLKKGIQQFVKWYLNYHNIIISSLN